MTKKQKSGAGAEGDYQLVQHEVRVQSKGRIYLGFGLIQKPREL